MKRFYFLFGGTSIRLEDGVAVRDTVCQRLFRRLVLRGETAFYFNGIGTNDNDHALIRLYNAAFAPPQCWRRILDNACEKFDQEGIEDCDQVYLVGFSRGGALARRFAATMSRWGMPVHFLGTLDPVVAVGKPNLFNNVNNLTEPVSDIFFEDLNISPNVQSGLALYAAHENRRAFAQAQAISPKVESVWMRGSHEDIGGGSELSRVAESEMAVRLGLDPVIVDFKGSPPKVHRHNRWWRRVLETTRLDTTAVRAIPAGDFIHPNLMAEAGQGRREWSGSIYSKVQPID